MDASVAPEAPAASALAPKDPTMIRSVLTVIEVVLLFPKKNKDLLSFAQNVVKNTTDSPYFNPPPASLAPLTQLIKKFQDSENAAVSKAPGAASQRDADKKALKDGLKYLRNDIQAAADKATGDVVALVESTGMKVKKHTVPVKPAFGVRDGAVSGTVHLEVKVLAAYVMYYWQFSVDDKNWQSVPDTAQGNTSISGLTAGQTYYFRYRALTRKGVTDWSQGLSHLVK
jgi:hypothetical protein